MSDRRLITDRLLKSLRPAPKSTRSEIWDSREPDFGLRISDREDRDPQRRGKAGKITFQLYARFQRDATPSRRSIGVYGAISLEEARRTAGEWKSLIAKGIDPAVIEAEAKAEAARAAALRSQNTVAAVADDWFAAKVRKERGCKDVERNFRTYFIAAWGDRPINEISRLDVKAIIDRKKSSAPQMARSLLIMVTRFFDWADDQETYGLTSSPCDRLKAKKLIGRRSARKRKLNDVEVFAFWRATQRMGHPFGSAYRLLLLTGLRLNEVVEMPWSEIENEDHAIIAASRMKSREEFAVEHLAPFSRMAQEVIASLPRPKGARFLFSFDGKRPMHMGTRAKRELDRRNPCRGRLPSYHPKHGVARYCPLVVATAALSPVQPVLQSGYEKVEQ